MSITLRPYQQEFIDMLPESGSVLGQMATGLGKTFTVSQIPRKGRVLILSHREELVEQPRKYFNCSFGIERAKHKSNGEEVVSASVQSLVRRLDKFKPNEFDLLITDECHRASSPTYQKIYEYFKPRLHVGITATPNRSDGVSLENTFDEIFFERDLQWGIKNKYLCDLKCIRVNIGFDLSSIKKKTGDYTEKDLDKVLNQDSMNHAIVETHKKHAKGQTLIFACSVSHAEELGRLIPNSAVVTGKTKNRSQIIYDFENKKIKCLINCMVFVEGFDCSISETLLFCRPTKSELLYNQAVGRILRLHPDKKSALLIDMVGSSKNLNICTAPSLIGIDLESVPSQNLDDIEGDLFDIPEIVNKLSDVPESWIRNYEIVNLWARKRKYKTHKVNYFKFPDGSLKVSLKKNSFIKISPEDKLGNVVLTTSGGHINKCKIQKALDTAYKMLIEYKEDEKYLWDLRAISRWKNQPASDAQIKMIKRFKIETENLTKFEASQILNRKFNS